MKENKSTSGKKWFKLIAEVKEESDMLSKIIKQGSVEREKCNLEYSKFAQKTFNSIHNVKRQKNAPTTVPRVKSRKSNRKNDELFPTASFDVMEFETPVTNADKWPRRCNSAKRTFMPEKLDNYPNPGRTKDVFVLSGSSIMMN